MTVAEAEQTETIETAAPVADAVKPTDKIFEWSRFVHVGEGAEECAHKHDGTCSEPDHFHAWIRLPNPFQLRDIVDKANAAKARKLRDLRDPDSDASVTLDGELEEMRALGDDGKEIIADELVAAEYNTLNQRAVREVDALLDEVDDEAREDDPDDKEPPKKWALIDQDIEELQRQEALPEAERSEDFTALQTRVSGYYEAVSMRLEKLEDERKAELMARSLDDLHRLVRRDRCQVQGTEVYLHTYNTWQWFVCTFKPKPPGEKEKPWPKGMPNERVWRDISHMKYDADSTVIMSIREAFDGLESALRSRRAGKGS